jgi:hypothetical protein
MKATQSLALRRVTAVTRILKTQGRGLWVPLGILLGGVVAQNLAALVPWSIELAYSRTFYPRLLSLLSIFSSWFSQAVGEISICFLSLCALAFIGRSFFLIVKRKGERARLLKVSGIYAVWLSATLLWSFLLTFGLNYQRPLLFELLGYEQRKAETHELVALGEEIVRGVNESYLEAHAGGRAVPDNLETLALLKEAYDTSPELALLPRGNFTPPKPVYFSDFLTRLGISGFYFPYTGEPHYNADAPDFQIVFSMAHEMAHQRGVARESEANFVAYLVCVSSRDPFIRYSGYRNGLGVLSELHRREPEKARKLAGQLGAGYREDSRRAAQFWAKSAGAAGILSQRINDLYLRANRVKSGVADYRGVTALIIGHYLRKAPRADSPPAR